MKARKRNLHKLDSYLAIYIIDSMYRCDLNYPISIEITEYIPDIELLKRHLKKALTEKYGFDPYMEILFGADTIRHYIMREAEEVKDFEFYNFLTEDPLSVDKYILDFLRENNIEPYLEKGGFFLLLEDPKKIISSLYRYICRN